MNDAREVAARMGMAYLIGLHTAPDGPEWDMRRVDMLGRSLPEVEAFIMGLRARSDAPKFKLPKKLRRVDNLPVRL